MYPVDELYRPLAQETQDRRVEFAAVPAGQLAPVITVEPGMQPRVEVTVHGPEQVPLVAPKELPKNPAKHSEHVEDTTSGNANCPIQQNVCTEPPGQ